MNDLPSHNIDIGSDSLFDELPSHWNYPEDDGEAEPPLSQNKLSGYNGREEAPNHIHDENDGYGNGSEEILNFYVVNLEESSTSKEELNSTTDFIGTDNNNSQSQLVFNSNSTTDSVNDEPTTSLSTDKEPITEETPFVQIKKSPSKRAEGHYKADGDVIVTKPFLADKGKRIIFQTDEVINHGETVTISMTAVKKLEKKLADKPIGKTMIRDESQCECYSLHEESPFCVKSEQATVEWVRKNDSLIVVLKPVRSDYLEFNIGIYKNFGKNFVAQLEFQLERDREILRQKYFVKVYALLWRGLTDFVKDVNLNFPDRCKWFKKGAACEDDEPRRKKIRLSEEEESFQINPLLVQCPQENTIELLNLLEKDHSQYQYLRL